MPSCSSNHIHARCERACSRHPFVSDDGNVAYPERVPLACFTDAAARTREPAFPRPLRFRDRNKEQRELVCTHPLNDVPAMHEGCNNQSWRPSIADIELTIRQRSVHTVVAWEDNREQRTRRQRFSLLALMVGCDSSSCGAIGHCDHSIVGEHASGTRGLQDPASAIVLCPPLRCLPFTIATPLYRHRCPRPGLIRPPRGRTSLLPRRMNLAGSSSQDNCGSEPCPTGTRVSRLSRRSL